MPRRSLASFAAGVLALGGCSADLAVPKEAQLLCAPGGVCPDGFVCNDVLGRCVWAAAQDKDAPRLEGSAAVDPPVGGRGRSFAVSFRVNEPLGREPEVRVRLGSGARPLAQQAREGSSFVYVYTAGGDEPEGPAPVEIRLVDAVGNVAEGLAGGSMSFDFTPPALAAGSVQPAVLTKGARLVVSVTPTEALGEPLAERAEVRVGGFGVATLAQEQPGAGTLLFEYAPTPTDPEGEAVVTARLRDAAGNDSGPLAVGTARLDFTAPALDGPALLSDALLRAGEVLAVQVRFTEPPAGAPVVRMVSDAATEVLDRVVVAPVLHTYLHVVEAAEHGAHVLWLDGLSDAAGNASPPIELGRFAVDAAPPLALGWTVTPARAKAGTPLSAAFEVSEAVTDVQVTVDGVAMELDAASGDHFLFRHDASTGEGEGVKQVSAQFADRAGNRAFELLGIVTYDFTPPGVASAAVAYTPDAANPLGVVSRARAGTRVTVTLVADETLRTSVPPTLGAGGALVFSVVPGSFTSAGVTFQTVVPESASDGTYLATLRWSDLAGNDAATTLAAPILVKTSAPTLTVDQAQVAYLRSPWGNAAAESLGAFTIPAGAYFALAPAEPLAGAATLPASAFTLGASAPALVRIWADPDRETLLGTVAPQGGSWPRQRLSNLDAPTIYATGLDGAGNESAAVKIENAEWVATPRAPALGASPHRLEATTYVEVSRAQNPATATSIGGAGAGAEGSDVVVRSMGAWRERAVSGGARPSARTGHAMAYDSARGRVVLFGGGDGAELAQDVWEWDGRVWVDRTPAGPGPGGRRGHSMAYDSARGRVVLFGGWDVTGARQDLWEWDGGAWVERTPAGARPTVREGITTPMVYDSARGRVVLLSVERDDLQLFDLLKRWEWDGSSWTGPLSAAEPRPGARNEAALAYDTARGQVVLFGGVGTEGCGRCDDLWEWNTSAWVERAFTATWPRDHVRTAMAHDSARGRTVLFGGDDGNDSPVRWQDVWEWDGSSWTGPLEPAKRPGARSDHALAYDSARGRVVLFGGRDEAGALNDTWEWDGRSWTAPQEPAPKPGGEGYAAAYDAARGRTVLYGTSHWEWDGSSWTGPLDPGPGDRSSHAMAYDSARRRTVLFGGRDRQDVWEWDGSSWTGPLEPDPNPGVRSWHAMAYDAGRGRTVMFGGLDAASMMRQDVWEWDGSSWTGPLAPAKRPSARYAHAMAYDAGRGRTVLFGGDDGSNRQDVWEWDGSSWTGPFEPEPRPGPRQLHAMAYDSVRSRVVMFGGVDVVPDKADLWEWDGSSWTGPFLPAKRPGFLLPTLVYDSARARTVLWGAFAGKDEFWEWDASTARQPAVQLDVSFAAAGIAVPSVTGLRIRAHCGGLAPSGTGAALWGWLTGGPTLAGGLWSTLASNSAGLSAAPPAALIDRLIADPLQARRFVLERDRQLSFQCRPKGVSGPSDAQVALDYLEVRVKYRAP